MKGNFFHQGTVRVKFGAFNLAELWASYWDVFRVKETARVLKDGTGGTGALFVSVPLKMLQYFLVKFTVYTAFAEHIKRLAVQRYKNRAEPKKKQKIERVVKS